MGADIYQVDTKDGWSPLHYAVQNGNIDMIKFLLQNGANPPATEMLQEITCQRIVALCRDTRSWTLLHWAADRGDEKTFIRLIQQGADPFEKAGEGEYCRSLWRLFIWYVCVRS